MYHFITCSYQVNLSSEVSAMFNSLMPSLNSRSLPFVVFLGGFPSRCQNLSSGAIRPGGLLYVDAIEREKNTDVCPYHDIALNNAEASPKQPRNGSR